MYGQPSSFYPKVGGGGGASHGRNPPYHPAPAAPAPAPNSGTGIRVSIKPEYRITPPPQLMPQVSEIPRSNFSFDFEFEKMVLAEAGKENPNWSRLGIEIAPAPPPPRAAQSHSNYGHTSDPIVNKYIAAGLRRDAVPIAVAHFGDNPTKVKEFVNSYTVLQEMGFPPNNVVEALIVSDNDKDKALAHLLNNSTS